MGGVHSVVGDNDRATTGARFSEERSDTVERTVTDLDVVGAFAQIDRDGFAAGMARHCVRPYFQPRSSAMPGKASASMSTSSPAITSRETVRLSMVMSAVA